MKVKLRDNQPEIVENILNAFRSGKKVVVLNAPTGVGKSIINMVSAQSMGTAYTTTPLRTLVDQYRDTVMRFDEDELGWVIMGRGAYPCPFLQRKEEKEFNEDLIKLNIEDPIKIIDMKKIHLKKLSEITAEGAPCARDPKKYNVGEGNGYIGEHNQFVSECPSERECPYYMDLDKARLSRNAIMTIDYFMSAVKSSLGNKKDVKRDDHENDITLHNDLDILKIKTNSMPLRTENPPGHPWSCATADVDVSKCTCRCGGVFHNLKQYNDDEWDAKSVEVLEFYKGLKNKSNEDDVTTLSRWKWGVRNMLVIDEAHFLSEKFVDIYSLNVTEKSYPGMDIKTLTKYIDENKKNLKTNVDLSNYAVSEFLKVFLPYLNSQKEVMNELHDLEDKNVKKTKYNGKEIKLEEALQKQTKLLRKLENVKTVLESEVEFVYGPLEGGFYLKPYSPKYYLKSLWNKFDYILLSSATFFDVPLYLDDLGLSDYKYKLIDVPSSFDPEKSLITREGILYLSKKNFDTTIDKVVEKVDEILDQHPDERGMIHCFSSAYRSE